MSQNSGDGYDCKSIGSVLAAVAGDDRRCARRYRVHDTGSIHCQNRAIRRGIGRASVKVKVQVGDVQKFPRKSCCEF